MDEIDRQILTLLARNARLSVKEIAQQVALTSPAVSSRIRKLEKSRVIAGYTVLLHQPEARSQVDALISLSAAPNVREQLVQLMRSRPEVLQCYHVTGDYSFLIKVRCPDMSTLEHLITAFQKLGQTSTQIILSVPVDRTEPGLSELAIE